MKCCSREIRDMKKKIWLLCVLVFALLNPAYAVEGKRFFPLGKDIEGSEQFLDLHPIPLENGIGHCWVKTIFSPKAQNRIMDAASKAASKKHNPKIASFMLNYYALDLPKRMIRQERAILYYKDNTHYTRPLEPSMWEPITPGSLGEFLYDTLEKMYLQGLL